MASPYMTSTANDLRSSKRYGGAFGSKMQLDRNLHPIGSYCMLFVRELYAIRSCLYGIRSYTPFYRTGHSVVLPIRSYRAFGRTPHLIVPSIRSYFSGGWTRLAKHHGRIIVSSSVPTSPRGVRTSSSYKF